MSISATEEPLNIKNKTKRSQQALQNCKREGEKDNEGCCTHHKITKMTRTIQNEKSDVDNKNASR